jgi:Kef-type K+ transport system membrane component KefB
MDEVPVQFFQSVIAIELAVTGALLWNIHYFERPKADDGDAATRHPNTWVLLGVALVLMATLLGSLYAISDHGQQGAASAVTIGLALSSVPILLRVLPPLRHRSGNARRLSPQPAVTVVALIAYTAAVAAFVIGLNS